MTFGDGDADKPTLLPGVTQMQAMIALGVFGGMFIGWQAVKQSFVVGLEDKERKGLLLFSGSILLLFGAKELLGIDEKYLTGGWLDEKAEDWFTKTGTP
jgi:hypothetical protein